MAGKPEIAVFMVAGDSTCDECGDQIPRGRLLRKEGERALCIECADLDHLVYLPRGDTALTRRTTKHMPMKVVVLKWSRARKRHERQGILASEEAIARAEQECLSDEDRRARHRERAAVLRDQQDAAYVAAFAAEIRRSYPGCPEGAEQAIAAHACRKHSGRVGRSAAARELDPEAIRMAVVAHVRHVHTDYDLLLAQHDREEARRIIRPRVDAVLAAWS